MSTTNGRIAVVDGVLVIEGVSFEVTPSLVDSGDLRLRFENCYSAQHGGTTFRAKGHGEVVGNAFGSSPKHRPWWRLW